MAAQTGQHRYEPQELTSEFAMRTLSVPMRTRVWGPGMHAWSLRSKLRGNTIHPISLITHTTRCPWSFAKQTPAQRSATKWCERSMPLVVQATSGALYCIPRVGKSCNQRAGHAILLLDRKLDCPILTSGQPILLLTWHFIALAMSSERVNPSCG